MEFNYNKCPECGYVNNNQPNVCPSCGCNLAEYRQRLREEAELAEKEKMYLAALHLFSTNEYQAAAVAFLVLGDYKESVSYAEKSEKALFDATVVKEFLENPFISALYSADAHRKENVSDAVLKECMSDPKTIEELRGKFEKYAEKKHLPVEKYMVACTEALKELEYINEEPLREKYERGKENLSDGLDCYNKDFISFDHGCFELAIKIFEELGEYKDAPILLEQAKKECLELGKFLVQRHQYYDAKSHFFALGNYENAPELYQEAKKLYVEIEQPRIKIKEEIDALEKQIREAKGLFAESKKKSLQKKIDALKAQI